MGAATEPPTNEAPLTSSLDRLDKSFLLPSPTKYSVCAVLGAPTYHTYVYVKAVLDYISACNG